MKNFKKILLLVLLSLTVFTVAALGVFADGEYTGTVEGLNQKVQVAVNAPDDDARLQALRDIGKYIDATPVDPSAEGYAEVMATAQAQALACANAFLSQTAATTVTSTARNQIPINKIKVIVELGICDESNAEYAAFLETFAARCALQDAAREENRQKMLAQGNLSAYNDTIIMDNDCSSSIMFPTKGNLGSNTIDINNEHLNVRYGAQDTQNTYVQIGFSSDVSVKGIVVDFDFTSFDMLPPGGFHLEGGGHEGIGDASGWSGEKMPSGAPKVYASYFKIGDDGSLKSNEPDGSKVLLEKAIVIGQWTHLTCIFDPDAFTFSLYCEYEHIGTYTGVVKNKFKFNLSATRFAATTKVKSSWSADNISIYQGSALRDLQLFSKMSKPEEFAYYANYYMNEDLADTLGRYTSYQKVLEKLSTYANPDGSFIPFDKPEGMSDEDYARVTEEVRVAVANIATYDNTKFIEKLGVENRNTFIGYVNELSKIERVLTDTSVNDRKKVVTRIEEFLLSIDGIVDENDEYHKAVKQYQELSAGCYVDSNIFVFNKHMTRYGKVTALNSLEKYYKLAYDVFFNSDYPIDPALAELPGYEEFKLHYEVFMKAAERIENVKKDKNSEKIIACVDLVSVYEKSEWDANYDAINPYIVMIRKTLAENYYNPDYVGIEQALAVYREYDEYFYALLQQVHIAELTTRLDYVYNNDAYIEKMGALSYITRYLETNDIDYNNAEIARLYVNYQTALDELNFREVDYETVLRQNASYFISLVEKMRISDGFNAKKELYDTAIGFYFALDANVEGAREAIEVFDEHTLWFETVDAASNLFLDAVALLRVAEDEDAIYAALVDCYVYSLNVELTYDGVAEAMEYYTEQYEAYNSAAEAVNAAVEGAGVAVASVRANCGVQSVIAVIIKKIFD